MCEIGQPLIESVAIADTMLLPVFTCFYVKTKCCSVCFSWVCVCRIMYGLENGVGEEGNTNWWYDEIGVGVRATYYKMELEEKEEREQSKAEGRRRTGDDDVLTN